ncbi:MAG: hypothetical protein K2X74_22450 [Acetobacteraceae bacterium]|nr:hypothetical protein [Acetobacteraceae bacterium]
MILLRESFSIALVGYLVVVGACQERSQPESYSIQLLRNIANISDWNVLHDEKRLEVTFGARVDERRTELATDAPPETQFTVTTLLLNQENPVIKRVTLLTRRMHKDRSVTVRSIIIELNPPVSDRSCVSLSDLERVFGKEWKPGILIVGRALANSPENINPRDSSTPQDAIFSTGRQGATYITAKFFYRRCAQEIRVSRLESELAAAPIIDAP